MKSIQQYLHAFHGEINGVFWNQHPVGATNT